MKGKDSDRWHDAIRIYEDEMAELGWDLSPYINLLKRIAKSGYADDLYPRASRWYLSFSMTNDFEAGLNLPMVSIVYRQYCQIEYWTRPGWAHDLQKWRCHESQVWPLLESLFLRLRVESEAAHAT